MFRTLPWWNLKRALLPPLHTNLWFMKNSAKVVAVSPTFVVSFRISETPKLNAGLFVGPQITKVILDENFAKKLNNADWTGCVEILQINSSWPSGEKRGKLPRNHTKSVTKLAEVSCHWNSTSNIHTSASFPENLRSSRLWWSTWNVSPVYSRKAAMVLVKVGSYCCWWNSTLHSLFISENCSTCFGWYLHPSSGAHTTVSTASGTCQTVTARGRSKPDGTRWRVGGEVKGKQAIGEGSHYLALYLGTWSMVCPLIRTSRLPVVDWTDSPADLNGLVHFSERPNLVSARVPSRFKRALPAAIVEELAGSSNGLTSTRCYRYSCVCSWWWVEIPPETCRAVLRNE